MSNLALADEFVAAWSAMDIDRIMDCFTDDAVYINIPMEPINRGKAEIRTFIEGFLASAKSCEFLVHHQVEDVERNLIMNERTDTLDMGEHVVKLPVMGVYEFREGKICAWRDYFDMAPFSA